MSIKPGEVPAYKLAVLRDRGKDLSKEWYIEFYAYSEKEAALVRKRVKVPLSFHTERQRRDWSQKQINQINGLLQKGYHFSTAPLPEPERVVPLTISELVQVAGTKLKTLRAKSQADYKALAVKFRDWLGTDQNKGIEAITPASVSDYIDYLLDSGITNNTINNQLNKTRIVFGKLVKAGVLERNPFVYEKLPETENYSNRAYLLEHQQTIENFLLQHHYSLYIFTRWTYYNFIRPGELIRLKIQDIDFHRKTITVPGTVSKNRKTLTIPLHHSLYELIKDYRHYPASFYIAGKGMKPGRYKAGENAAYEAHKEILNKAGLQDFEYTLYSWKHTGAVRAYEAGTDLKTLQFLLRHTSVKYTEIYLKSLRLQLNEIQLKDW